MNSLESDYWNQYVGKSQDGFLSVLLWYEILW